MLLGILWRIFWIGLYFHECIYKLLTHKIHCTKFSDSLKFTTYNQSKFTKISIQKIKLNSILTKLPCFLKWLISFVFYFQNKYISKQLKVLANKLWCENFEIVDVVVLALKSSEHCPLLINFESGCGITTAKSLCINLKLVWGKWCLFRWWGTPSYNFRRY